MRADRSVLCAVRFALPLAVLGACALDRSGLVSDGALDPPDASVDARERDAPLPSLDSGCTFGAETSLIRLGAPAFAAPGVVATRVAIDADHLVLELAPHRYGGLLGHGFDGALPIDLDTLLATRPDAGSAFITSTQISLGTIDPDPFAARFDGHTVLLVGEAMLEAGNLDIDAYFDDEGAIRLEVGATPIDLRGAFPDHAMASVTVPEVGWYPIVIAWNDELGTSEIDVRFQGPGDTSPKPLGGGRLRARRDASVGRELLGWSNDIPSALPDGARIDASQTSVDWARGRPGRVGITRDDDFVVRWLGRTRTGSDALEVRAESDDTHRFFLDGVAFGARYGMGSHDATYPTSLRDGTYDVVYEVRENNGDAGAILGREVASAPWAGDAWSPALRFGGVAFTAALGDDRTVAPGATERDMVTMRSPDDVPTAVEVSTIVRARDPFMLDVRIEHDGMTWEEVFATSGRPGIPGEWIYRRVLLARDGVVRSTGDWRVTIVNRGTEAVQRDVLGVLAHHGGIASPYPAVGIWVSEPVPLDGGGSAVITQVALDTAAFFGTQVSASLRVADDAVALETAPWLELDAVGAPRAVAFGRLAQVRAELRGPSTDTPRVRTIELRGAPCRP